MYTLARTLVIIGIMLVITGGLVYLAGRAGLPLGRLPGDFRVQNENITCLIPLGTSILLSIVFTILLNLIIRLLR